MMAWSKSPLGPFSKPVMVYDGADLRGDAAPATGDTNLAAVIFDDGSIASSGTAVSISSGSISLVDNAVSRADSTAAIDKAVANSGDGSTTSVHKPVSHNGSIGTRFFYGGVCSHSLVAARPIISGGGECNCGGGWPR